MSIPLWLSVALVSLSSVVAKFQGPDSCDWGHLNLVQQEYHKRHLKQILDPVTDTAVLLARQGASGGGNSSMLGFAARLMRVHDQLEESCHDHHWEEALSHKICASYIRWEPQLRLECRVTNQHIQGTLHRIWGQHCFCVGLEPLLHDCRHHVLPWAHDSHTCEHILKADCKHTHPLGGLCAYRTKLTRTRMARKNRMKWQSTHFRHNTKPKHSAWKKHAASEEGKRKGKEYIDRVRRKSGTKASFKDFNAR